MFKIITLLRTRKAAKAQAHHDALVAKYAEQLFQCRANNPANPVAVEPRKIGHSLSFVGRKVVSRSETYDLGKWDELESAFRGEESSYPTRIVTLPEGERYWVGSRDRSAGPGAYQTLNIETGQRGPDVTVSHGSVTYTFTYTDGPMFASNVRKILGAVQAPDAEQTEQAS